MEQNKRLIDLDMAIAKIKDEGVLGEGYAAYERIEDVCDMLEDCPTVEAVEVVHAKWEKAYIAGYLKCNSCKDAFIYEEWLKSGKWNYCPHCGAKMDGDGNA